MVILPCLPVFLTGFHYLSAVFLFALVFGLLHKIFGGGSL